jgi:hypothetical protein
MAQEGRSPSANDLAADLQRQLQGSPTAARPLTRAGRVLRAIVRHPAQVAAALVAVFLIAMIPVLWTWLDPNRLQREIEAALVLNHSLAAFANVILEPLGSPN